jgi:alpha-tubulin suppressor-like RCC1 family protein
LSDVTAIAAGSDYALALRSDGSVYAWGFNRNGKLGDGTETDRPTPVATLLTSGIVAIAANDQHSLALRNDGVVLSWGINETGQLGSGSSSPGFRPQPAPVVGLANVTAIAAGGPLGHSLALRNDGSVWAWGHNDAGQLGNGNTNSANTPVAVMNLTLN